MGVHALGGISGVVLIVSLINSFNKTEAAIFCMQAMLLRFYLLFAVSLACLVMFNIYRQNQDFENNRHV